MSSTPSPSSPDSPTDSPSPTRNLSDSEPSLLTPSTPPLSASEPSLLAPSPPSSPHHQFPTHPSSPQQQPASPPSPIPSTISFTSLPDSASSDTISLSPSIDALESDAEREWKESLQQLELLLTMVVVPYLGKYFGRRCAYWGWAKYMEWKYPVEIEITNKTSFKVAGAVEAAATL